MASGRVTIERKLKPLLDALATNDTELLCANSEVCAFASGVVVGVTAECNL